MKIARPLIDELVEHALEESPLECCGVIGFRGGEAIEVCRCHNAAESATRYELDGLEHMATLERFERDGLELRAVYHSHTVAPVSLSQTDVDFASPDLWYVVIGVQDPDWPEVRAYRLPECSAGRGGEIHCIELLG